MSEIGENERKEREEKLEKFIKQTLRKLFGPRYETACLSKIGITFTGEDQELIRAWLKNQKNMLVILGSVGIGKTYLCAALFAEAIKSFNTYRFYNEQSLITKLHNAINNGESFKQVLKNSLDDQFIIIDDIGSSRLTEFTKDIIFNTLDLRYSSQMPTVITSNLTKEQFEKELGFRTVDRVFNKDNTIIQIFDLPSLRQKKEAI